jgi:hypothetical protein
MEETIVLFKGFWGEDLTRGVEGREVVASRFNDKVLSWTRLCDLSLLPYFPSDNPHLDQLRGPFRVFAKIPLDAANLLRLSKGSGWYVTDILPKHV